MNLSNRKITEICNSTVQNFTVRLIILEKKVRLRLSFLNTSQAKIMFVFHTIILLINYIADNLYCWAYIDMYIGIYDRRKAGTLYCKKTTYIVLCSNWLNTIIVNDDGIGILDRLLYIFIKCIKCTALATKSTNKKYTNFV